MRKINEPLDELEITSASVVKQDAHDFTAALAESQKLKTFEQSTLRFLQDEAAQKDMQLFKKRYGSCVEP